MRSDFDAKLLEQIDAIRRIGRARLVDTSETEDFVQETLIRAYTRRRQLTALDRLPQWVGAIARNAASNWNRDRHYLPILTGLAVEAKGVSPSALERMEQAERFQQLREAMDSLDPTDRDMLIARVVEGASYTELERRYGLSNSAVGARLHRARSKVRKRLRALTKTALAWFLIGGRHALGRITLMKWNTLTVTSSVIGAAIVAGTAYVASSTPPTVESPNPTLDAESLREARAAQSPKLVGGGSQSNRSSSEHGAEGRPAALPDAENATVSNVDRSNVQRSGRSAASGGGVSSDPTKTASKSSASSAEDKELGLAIGEATRTTTMFVDEDGSVRFLVSDEDSVGNADGSGSYAFQAGDGTGDVSITTRENEDEDDEE